jgi:hypothetical protein
MPRIQEPRNTRKYVFVYFVVRQPFQPKARFFSQAVIIREANSIHCPITSRPTMLSRILPMHPEPDWASSPASSPILSTTSFATAHDWWTPEGSKRILSGDRYVKEIEATTSVVQ